MTDYRNPNIADVLGSVDISSSPDEHGGDFEKSEEINGFLLEA